MSMRTCSSLAATSLLLAALSDTATAQQPYGHGTANQNGLVPRLRATQPHLGNLAVTFTIDRGAASAPAALFVSAAPADYDLLGSAGLISPLPGDYQAALPLLLDPSGAGTVQTAIPPTATQLLGARLYLQAATLDTPGSGSFLPVSNGLAIEVTDAPLLFLGGDVLGGSNDPYELLDPATLAVIHNGTAASEDISGAVFADGGRTLYVASRTSARIDRLDVATRSWSTFASSGDQAIGVQLDQRRRRLWTLSGPLFAAKDLVAYDADPTAATYGAEVARATLPSTVDQPRSWSLAAQGDRIALWDGVGMILIVDTAPGSATFLQVLHSEAVPGHTPPFNSVGRILLTADASQLLVALTVGYFSAPSGVQRYDVAANQWIDHNPFAAGVQPIGPGSSPPGPMIISSDLALARDESFAVITDYNRFWRIDLDRDAPGWFQVQSVWGTWTPATSLGHTVLADGRVLIVGPDTSWPNARVWAVDPFTGVTTGGTPVTGPPAVRTIAER